MKNLVIVSFPAKETMMNELKETLKQVDLFLHLISQRH